MSQSIETLTTLPEIILTDKPFGISSFDVIRIVQKHFGKIKIGHAGTLDPRATGLMILGVGKGTKQLTELTGLDKTYVADILLGQKTKTGDLEGEVVEEKKDFDLNKKDVEEKIMSLQGIQHLPVSLFSAIKKDGKPLYQYARNGKEVEQPVREMKIHKAEFLDCYPFQDFYITRARFEVSKGTYIRSLGEELGKRLGVPATLHSLRRVRVGEYDISQAFYIPLEWIQDFKNNRKRKEKADF